MHKDTPVWEQPIGSFPIDFEEQGDEWAHHLAVELTGSKWLPVKGTDGSSPVELGPPMSGPVKSKLRVERYQGGVVCVVTGEEGSPADDQVDPWRRAAEAAVAALGNRHHDFEWSAIIDTRDDVLHGLFRIGALKTPLTLGSVRLTPGGVCLRTHVVGADDLYAKSHGFRYTFPVVASGHVSTYDWDQAEIYARYCLRRTCAVLTACTGALWVPRSRPMPAVDGRSTLRVPIEAGPTPEITGDPWDGMTPAETPPLELPAWIGSTWKILSSDEGLDTSLNAHYEARVLDGDHPSVALALYVAAIEGFGQRFVPDTQCPNHPECPHSKGVAQKRFRKALKTIMTNREVDELSGLAYSLRSYTDHRGTLFSSEAVFGYPIIRYFAPTGDVRFEYGVLWPIREASRRVLSKAFQVACDPHSS